MNHKYLITLVSILALMLGTALLGTAVLGTFVAGPALAQEEPAQEEPAKEEPAKEEPAQEKPAEKKEEPAKEKPSGGKLTKEVIAKELAALKQPVPAAAAEEEEEEEEEAAPLPNYTLTPDDTGMVLKTPDGRVVFAYMTKKPEKTNLSANSVCCLYPVNTPRGVRAVDFAPDDHRHHRGIFFAWHALKCDGKRSDFWGWGEWAPTEGRVIANQSVTLTEASNDRAVLEVRNAWMVGEATVIEEVTTITVREQDEVFVIDQDFRLTPKVDITLMKTAFGGFCVKGRKDGKADYFTKLGKVKSAAPNHLLPQKNWEDSSWYDYVIDLEELRTVGVAVIGHPKNPATTWHNVKEIAMVNPCIVAPEEVTLDTGKTLRLRYRVVVHDGLSKKKLLNKLSTEFRSN